MSLELRPSGLPRSRRGLLAWPSGGLAERERQTLGYY